MKKTNKSSKGFTLVELIVVIVILGILAAILVPALLGYIDRAKEQQIVLNAKSALTSAQAELSSMYAKDGKITDENKAAIFDRILDTADIKDVCEELEIGCDVAFAESYTDAAAKRAAYKITYVSYKQGGKTIVYDGSSWDSTNSKPSTVLGAYKYTKPTT